jgi:hypothetical protein
MPAELDRENTYTDTQAAQELSCFLFGYHSHRHVAAGVWLGVLAV